MSASALALHADTSNKRKNVIISTSISVASAMIILALIGWFVIWKRKIVRANQPENQMTISKVESQEDLELPLFEFATIQAATDNFSAANKIGEGGFGPVYKGELQSGQEVAVKRLAENSGQGLQEFKNEVILISKLQHRNLVKLLGCCIEREERTGYMPPEYAIDGNFSLKSDVFSFGVILLEMVSGKKNRGFFHPDHKLNLLGHAWKLWNEEKALELMDELMEQEYPEHEAIRCIQVGLLCVQQRPEDRPVMQTVLLMLDSESMSLPQPGRPGFYAERSLSETESSSLGKLISNEMTVTLLEGR
ncbi:Serine-threonine/tyrosine-protein kinase [Theobroma cacao]|nr:Serine-threonine/tyrosine-protein kinase [Theobroma cacao]